MMSIENQISKLVAESESYQWLIKVTNKNNFHTVIQVTATRLFSELLLSSEIEKITTVYPFRKSFLTGEMQLSFLHLNLCSSR
jgi:hypothetical protein